VEDEKPRAGKQPKGERHMESILVALVALLVITGLIVGGTRFSLYLFLLNAEGTRRFTQRMPVTEKQMSQNNEYDVERQQYYKVLDTSSSSARFARSSLMVMTLILLLAIMATISVVAGLFH
jgi:hypothetical protein